jgi:cell fate regulator YaaT (PSP1 superfamily)
MPVVVGIVFKRAGKVYYFDPDEIELAQGEKVIVKTSRGMEYGEVVAAPMEVPQEEITAPLKKVVRKASDEDHDQLTKNKQKEKEAYRTAEEKITKHNLPMKLIEVEFVFDGSKIIFYFTADGRVDFRDLVKDLASIFKTRIELRQIGVRDEAKMVGGLGPCGQRLCCTVFLGDFEPVSIKMAKEQDLPLNPLKISGVCGRLMCCLKYEYEAYVDFKKRAPRRGTRVKTEYGEARIVEYNVPKETIIAELESGQRVEMPLQTALQCTCGSKCCENKRPANADEERVELEDAEDVELLKELEANERKDSGRGGDKRKGKYSRPRRNYVVADDIIDENEGFIDTSLIEKETGADMSSRSNGNRADKVAKHDKHDKHDRNDRHDKRGKYDKFAKHPRSESAKDMSDHKNENGKLDNVPADSNNGANAKSGLGEHPVAEPVETVMDADIQETTEAGNGKNGAKNGSTHHHKKGKHGKHGKNGKPFKPPFKNKHHKNDKNDKNGDKGNSQPSS